MKNEKSITFGLVHGSWHRAECWQFLQERLVDMGHRALVVDLPIEDPHADFDTYAEVVADEFSSHENIVLVGHSRGGNVLPRAAGKLSVNKMIFLCAGFEKATIGRPYEEEEQFVPLRHSPEFESGIVYHENGLTSYDKTAANKVFYHDCPEHIRQWAIQRLRLQNRSDKQPELAEWPNIPQEYIYATHDRVVTPAWAKYAARNWLQVEPVPINSGHSPFLSQANTLAAMLVYMAQRTSQPHFEHTA